MDAVSGGKNMSGKMLFVSIALLVMLFFVETASAQVNVATLKQLQAALAGNDGEIIVTKTIVINEDLTLDGGGKTVNGRAAPWPILKRGFTANPWRFFLLFSPAWPPLA